ncbi:anti-sigma factor [Nocardioides zeae]|uniref:Regulator of SigK n=1 Tax=Nocardioides imazamoxiresistens TaxID=3231893 RepID=A0ABU3PUE9_9ACTN|nr:anti-sigma factor [Nocardioides zeae]MDT9592847.1 anti-sigma factor [Nocardioides zeae]
MTNDIHLLSGAYAVDALSDAERADFEVHLAQCESCRDEVASLREAAALLPFAAEVAPPAGLRASVLAQNSNVRPLPPESDAPVPAVGAPAASTAPIGVPAGVGASHATAAAPGGDLPGRDTNVVPLRRRRFRTALVAAAAAVIVAGGVGTVVQLTGDDSSSSQNQADEPVTAEAVLAAADVQATHSTLPLPDGAEASVHWSDDLGAAVISTADMPGLNADQVYQLWFQDEDDAMVPAGLMPGDTDLVLLDGDADAANAVGITVEPAGGSDEPTSDPIALFPLEEA